MKRPEPTPDRDSISRYGEARAAEFARIKQAQTELMAAFDARSVNLNGFTEMSDAAWAFDYLWALLDERRDATLAEVTR